VYFVWEKWIERKSQNLYFQHLCSINLSFLPASVFIHLGDKESVDRNTEHCLQDISSYRKRRERHRSEQADPLMFLLRAGQAWTKLPTCHTGSDQCGGKDQEVLTGKPWCTGEYFVRYKNTVWVAEKCLKRKTEGRRIPVNRWFLKYSC